MAKETIKEIMEHSVRLYEGQVIVCPQSIRQQTITFYAGFLAKNNKCFAYSNSVICFIVDKKMYATPKYPGLVESLYEAGFKRRRFYIPITTSEYPREERETWLKFCADAKKKMVVLREY